MVPAPPQSTPAISLQRDTGSLNLHAAGHDHHLQDAAQAGNLPAAGETGDIGAPAGIITKALVQP